MPAFPPSASPHHRTSFPPPATLSDPEKPKKGVKFDAPDPPTSRNSGAPARPGMNTQASNHFMKHSKRGRPFVKDVHDLFSTLIVSLQLETHRQFFKSYPNSFTTDQACLNLSSLKFSQSNRTADPRDPLRIVTTTTTTTFTMSREMAKEMCQHFMDARLIENAADPSSIVFKDRGIYMCTAKGLHILERFVSKNGISQQQLLKVFASQPICMKLLHLERRPADDELFASRQVIEMLFRRFAGRAPNLVPLPEVGSSGSSTGSGSQTGVGGPGTALFASSSTDAIDQTQGVALRPLHDRHKPSGRVILTHEYTLGAMQAVEWLLDFTTMASKEEAVESATHFVRYGFIELVQEKGRINKESSMIISVRGKEEPGLKAEGEFRCTDKAIYRITEHGARVARWPSTASSSSLISSSSSAGGTMSQEPGAEQRDSRENPHDERFQGFHVAGGAVDAALLERMDLSDRARTDFLESDLKASGFNPLKDSHTTKLTQILDEPALRSLFREFLRANFCEENLNYWLDVQDFRRRFFTSSSAAAGPVSASGSGKGKTSATTSMEKHHQDLIAMAFVIYNGYLAPHSPSELNIDHNLRGELVAYVNKNLPGVAASASNNSSFSGADTGLRTGSGTDLSSSADLVLGAGQQMHASQLQTMLRMYERIQAYIFRLMATDSVPKFCKTERFLSLMRSAQEWNPSPQDQADASYPVASSPNPSSAASSAPAKAQPSAPAAPQAPPVPMTKTSASSVKSGSSGGPEDEGERAKAYMTISQSANEKHAAKLKAQS